MRVHASRWLLFFAAVSFALGTPCVTGVAFAADPAGATTTSVPASPVAPAWPVLPAAPALTRYEQTDAAISYSGTWSAVKKTAASGRSYSRSKTAAASVNIVFDGTRLDWIATQKSGAGAADIYLDGVFVKTISLGATAASYQAHIWSTGTLTEGLHTVRIVRSASSAAGAYLSIDAVDVAGTVVPCQWVAKDSSLLAYQGSSVTACFTGTYLAWVGPKDATRGTATVTLDGGESADFDLQGGSPLYPEKLWDIAMLSSKAHTVKIEWTAAAGSAAASGTLPAADGFLIAGTATQAYVWRQLEDSDPRVLCWGTWTATAAVQVSGGSDKRAAAAGSMVTVTFTGTQLDWLAATGPDLGKADVSVDSGAAQVVDLSALSALYQQKVWSTGTLAAGTHTVQIAWDKGNAAGTAIGVDAFAVLGTLPSTTDVEALRIMWAEQKLADLSYRPGKIDGVIDREARGAITAFQKWEKLARSRKLTDAVYARLLTATRPTPSKAGGADPWIEVDKAKQLLLYCKNGGVVWTIPVSTGSPSVGFATPSGTYKIKRKTLETNPRWHPLYLHSSRYLAIHGYPNVPTQRASHGCIRTQIWDQRDLYPLISIGTNVFVY